MARIGADGASPATESDGDSTTDDTETARTETRATRASEGDPYDDATAGRDVYDPGSDDPTGEETGGDTTRTYPADDPEPETQEPSDSRSSRPDAGADDVADSSSVDETQGIRDRVREAGQRAREAATGAVGAARRVADRYEPPAGTGGDPFEGAQAGSDVIRNGRPGINPRRQAAEEAAEERREAAINAQRGAAEAVEQETGKNPFLQEAQDRQADAINAQRGAAEAVASETGANPLVAEQEESVAAQVADQTGLEAGEDFEVTTRGESIDVQLTDDGREQLRRNDEQFGDVVIDIPGTDKTVEGALGDASDDVTAAAQNVADTIFDEGGVGSESLIAEGLEAAGQDEAATRFEEGLRSFGKGTVTGAANIVNAPGLALGLKELGEFGAYSADQSRIEVEKALGTADEGDLVTDDDALRKTLGASGAAVDAGRQAFNANPAGFSGAAVGSLAASAGVMGGAAKISPAAGKATRFAIQPGEEIASAALTGGVKGTSRLSRMSTRGPTIPDYTKRLPGGKIDNEELAIAAVRKGLPKAKSAAGRVSRSYNKLGDPSRVGAGLGGLKLETEMETEESTGGYAASDDLLDDVLTQNQDLLTSSAKTELEADREQLADFGTDVRSQSGRATIENELTFERSSTRPRVRPEVDRSAPYRGRRRAFDQEREQVGQPWQFESELTGEAETETLLETEAETETELEQGFRTEFMGPESQQSTRDRLFERERLDVGEVETERTDIGEFEDFEIDVRQDTRFDGRQDFEFESETETETFLESETESEFEQELELEFEQERETELEAEGRKRPQFGSGEFSLGFETDDDLFASGIADADDLWNSEF